MEIGANLYTVTTGTVLPTDNTDTKPDSIPENESDQEETGLLPGDTVEISAGAEEKSGKLKGVIRLLQAGHFKGVSDVRLRINFHDEIAALENEKLAEVAENGVSELVGSIKTDISAFLQDNELGEEISGLLSETSQSLYDSMNAVTLSAEDGSKIQPGDIISQLQSAFDGFVEGINAGLESETEVAPEPGIDETVPTEGELAVPETDVISEPETDETPVITPQMALEQFLADLIESFTSKLQELESALLTTSVLPEISKPSGNGKAFDKFMNIYNELNGITSPEPLPETVDQTA